MRTVAKICSSADFCKLWTGDTHNVPGTHIWLGTQWQTTNGNNSQDLLECWYFPLLD